ncbi:MAG: hypothetical protein V4501_04495 [Pseudomonadota bacterium]
MPRELCLMKQVVTSTLTIYVTAALLSLLLAYDGTLRASVINYDGICYLQSAATLGTASLHEAMHICGQAQWPFYSMLIYGVTLLSQLSIMNAAYVLNGLLSLITVLSFIYLVKLLTDSKPVLWFAAAAILLMHEFNSVREYVIRDHGFWAFYLVSVALLIQYFRKPSLPGAMLWSGALLLATLFRVEGVIFLILLPWLAWFTQGQRLKQFLQLNLLSILAAAMTLLYLLLHQQTTVNLSRFSELLFQVHHGFQVLVQTFNDKSTALAQAILNGYSARDAKLIFGLMLIAWYGVSVIINLSIVYTLIALFTYHKKLLKLDAAARQVFLGYILINVLITAPFLVEYMFLSKRYLIALSLLLLVWVPFGLAAVWEQRRRSLTIITALLVIASALGGVIDFGYSKKYIRDAGLWLASNAPANSAIYSNDFQVMFYSNHFGNSIFAKAGEFANLAALSANKWQQYDYLAVHVNPRDSANLLALQQLRLPPTKVFANRRGDAVWIYVKPDKEN